MARAWVSKLQLRHVRPVQTKVAEGEDVWVCGGCKWWTCSDCKARDQHQQMLPPMAPATPAPALSVFDLAQDLGALGNEFAQMSNKRRKPSR